MAETEVQDDLSVEGDHRVWRRIPPWHLIADKNLRKVRISSAAFEDDTEDASPMSVVLGTEAERIGRQPASMLNESHVDYGVASLAVSLLREKNQKVVRDEQPEEPLHALIVGNKTGSVTKAFYRAAQWVLDPPGNAILAAKSMPPEWIGGLDAVNAHRLLRDP